MRRRWTSIALAAVLVACGNREREHADAARAAGDPLVARFAAALEEDRIEDARALMSDSFRAWAEPARTRDVLRTLRDVLGPMKSRTPSRVDAVAAEEDDDLPRSAVLVDDATFAKGAATLEAKVVRTGADWRIDAWSVSNDVFVWELRPVR